MTEAGLAVVVGATGTIGQAVIRRRGLDVWVIRRPGEHEDSACGGDGGGHGGEVRPQEAHERRIGRAPPAR